MRAASTLCAVVAFSTITLVRPGAAQTADSESRSGFTFLPGGSIHLPLSAADQEPRLGILKETGTSRLTLDIGSDLDLMEFIPGGNSPFACRAGIEAFATTLVATIDDRRLQIDAVDGYLGGYILVSTGESVTLRLRILHRSAHFVDGHYDPGTGTWRNGREPIPFTKDFGELLGAWRLPTGKVPVSLYAGVSYATLVRPTSIERFTGLYGVEITSGDHLGTVFGKPATIFGALHGSLDGIPVYVGTTNAAFGLKLGPWNEEGIRILARYRNGLEPFGQYYDVRHEAWSLGVQCDLH